MPVFSFNWHTTTDTQRGSVTVEAADAIRAVLFARRTVREKRLPGFDLARIILEPTEGETWP
jgi:hypothetical protein